MAVKPITNKQVVVSSGINRALQKSNKKKICIKMEIQHIKED